MLDAEVVAHYDRLTETEIKELVIDHKWFAAIETAITSEVQRLTQVLAGRVKELEERYADPLPQLEQELAAYSAKVAEHLKRFVAR